jgi:hypothetical protein
MIWKRIGGVLWAWSGYEIELRGNDAVTQRYELWCGTRFLGEFAALDAAKACVYGRELAP